jgi:N-methylhydantoinase B
MTDHLPLANDELDPFEVEVIRHGLTAAAEEMSLVVMRSARSPLLREAGDLSSTLTDEDGELIAQGKDIPVHLGVMAYTVKQFLEVVPAERLAEGDAWLLNHPEIGGNHLPDMKLIRPIFRDGDLLAFSVSLAHWADVGGAWPGSYFAGAFDGVQEGLRIPPLRVFTKAGVDEEKLNMVLANVRGPVERKGDLMAQMAATLAAERRVHELCDVHGVDVIRRTITRLHDLSEREMREALSALPDGVYEGVDFIDDGGPDNGPAAVRVRVEIRGDEASFDFSESDDVVSNYNNTTPNVVRSAVAYASRVLSARDMQPNGGCLRPLTVITRPGSLLDAGPDHPIVGGNHETSQRIVDAIFRAFERDLPERVAAAGPGTVGGLLIAERLPSGGWKAHYEVHGGGEGARFDRAGSDATRVHLVNTMNTPIEVIEANFSIQVERQQLRPDSGGAGQFHGGDGFVREYKMLADNMVLTTCVNRITVPPHGICGGEDGEPFALSLVRADGTHHVLPGRCNESLGRGDAVTIETSGGGGFGPPSEGGRAGNSQVVSATE